MKLAASFPAVKVDYEQPLSDVYRQMSEAQVLVFAQTSPGKDDPSFFFVRGGAAV